MNKLKQIGEILDRATVAAIDYYQLTGKPLGITGEIGEYLAAKHLRLDLAEARTAGYDAVGKNGEKIQIKARRIPAGKRLSGQRLGSIRLDHEWDVVVLVILNDLFEPQAMYQGGRKAITAALKKPGSKARNKKGALPISKFKSIGEQVLPKP